MVIDERLNSEENKRKRQIEIGKKIRALVDAGYSNKEIGEELGLQESVVRSIRADFYRP